MTGRYGFSNYIGNLTEQMGLWLAQRREQRLLEKNRMTGKYKKGDKVKLLDNPMDIDDVSCLIPQAYWGKIVIISGCQPYGYHFYNNDIEPGSYTARECQIAGPATIDNWKEKISK